MTDTYVVVAEVSGYNESNAAEKREILHAVEGVKVVDEYVRDDGSAELCFEWHPAAEENADGSEGARTWFEGSKQAAEVKSAIQAAALQLDNPLKIEVRDISRKAEDKPKAAKSTKSTAKTTG